MKQNSPLNKLRIKPIKGRALLGVILSVKERINIAEIVNSYFSEGEKVETGAVNRRTILNATVYTDGIK